MSQRFIKLTQCIKRHCQNKLKDNIDIKQAAPPPPHQQTFYLSFFALSTAPLPALSISSIATFTHTLIRTLSLPVLLTSPLLTGCMPNNSQEPQQGHNQSQTAQQNQSLTNTATAPKLPVLVNTVEPLQLQRGDVPQDERTESRDAKQVKEGLKNSYARLAAKRADVCPKLLQSSVDNNVIKRSDDVMVGDYCDYFIYPIPEQHIQVKSDNDQIEPLLVVPTLHNFANGSYQAQSAQKHVIRLKYNGTNYKADNLRYDISVIIE